MGYGMLPVHMGHATELEGDRLTSDSGEVYALGLGSLREKTGEVCTWSGRETGGLSWMITLNIGVAS